MIKAFTTKKNGKKTEGVYVVKDMETNKRIAIVARISTFEKYEVITYLEKPIIDAWIALDENGKTIAEGTSKKEVYDKLGVE